MSPSKNMFFLKSDPVPTFTNTANDTIIHIVVPERNLEIFPLHGLLSLSPGDFTSPLLLISTCVAPCPPTLLLFQVSTIPHQNDCILLLKGLSIFIPVPSSVSFTLQPEWFFQNGNLITPHHYHSLPYNCPI